MEHIKLSKFDDPGRILAIALGLFLLAQGLEYGYLQFHERSLADLCRWDCGWYQTIVENGYNLEPHAHTKRDAANWAFFPAFPLAAQGFGELFRLDSALALVIASKFFYLTSILSFISLASCYRPHLTPWLSGAVATTNPMVIYGNAGYSEPLFLTLTCISFICLHQRRYVLGGLLGGLLTGTRIVGGSIGFAYLFTVLSQWRRAEHRAGMVLGLALIPLGLAGFMGYLHWLMGDALAFVHVQVAWNHGPGNPLQHFLNSLDGSWGHWGVALNLVGVFAAIGLLCWKKHFELAIFSTFATLVPLSTGLASMPRYIWWQAPVLFALALLFERCKWLFWPYLLSCLGFWFFLYQGWFSGSNWVI